MPYDDAYMPYLLIVFIPTILFMVAASVMAPKGVVFKDITRDHGQGAYVASRAAYGFGALTSLVLVIMIGSGTLQSFA
jgi:hypothetical protein